MLSNSWKKPSTSWKKPGNPSRQFSASKVGNAKVVLVLYPDPETGFPPKYVLVIPLHFLESTLANFLDTPEIQSQRSLPTLMDKLLLLLKLLTLSLEKC